MGFVKKRGETWYIYYRDSEKRQKSKAIGSNKKEAEKALNEIENQLYKGTYRDVDDIGFKSFGKKWLTHKESELKPSTFKGYREIVNQHLGAYFKQRKLNRITVHDIDEYKIAKLDEGKLSNTTIGMHITILKMMLKQAVLWGYLVNNPAQYVSKPRRVHREMDFLKPEEIRLFLGNVRPKWYPFFLTAVFTGMRRGELLALQWGDIDWNGNYIHVRRSLSLKQIQEPKTKYSIRRIVVPPIVIKALREHQMAHGNPIQDKFIFPSNVGTLMDGRNLYQREFMAALKRAGLRQVRFHDLRHTYAALMISQGENNKFIQQQLGHASITTTMDTYGHLLKSPEEERKAASRLADTIFGNKQNIQKIAT